MTLTTAPLVRGEHAITVRGIRDLARKPNVMAPTSNTFRYEGLLVWWKLDEGMGAVVKDASGNGLPGKANGATWTNAAGRPALAFKGNWERLETPIKLDDLAPPFAITFWVSPVIRRSAGGDEGVNPGQSSPISVRFQQISAVFSSKQHHIPSG